MTTEIRNIARIGLFYLVGTAFNQCISLFSVPLFTRIMSTTDYGIVSTYLSWVAIVSTAVGFAMHAGIRIAFLDYRKQIDAVVSTVVTVTFIAFILTCILTAAAVLVFGIKVSLGLTMACLIQSFFTAIITDYSMYLMMHYRYKSRTVLMVLPNFLTIILTVIMVLFVLETNFYLGRIISGVVVFSVIGCFVIFLVYKKSKPQINKEYMQYTFKFSAPLILHGISLNVISQADRTMITALIGASQTAIYSVVYNLSMLVQIVTYGMEGVWMPWFLKKMESKQVQAINESAQNIVWFITAIVICLLLVSRELLYLIAPQPYWEGASIIPLIILASYIFFLYTLYVNVEHYYKKTMYIGINTSIAAAMNIGLNFILIPLYGYYAAAYTTLASYLLSLVLHINYVRKIDSELFSVKMFAMPMMHIGIAVVLFYALGNYGWTRWILAFVYVVGMVIYERKIIGQFVPKIAEKIPFFR